MARKPFVVLDAEILSSSVWSEAPHIKLVWITLLVLCDTDGYVGASVPGIASAAGVTLEQAREALARFQEPDPDSRTKTDEGRRLVVVDRGFRILNFKEHLDRLSADRMKARDRLRRFRERKRKGNVSETPGNVSIHTGNREKGVGKREKGSTDGQSVGLDKNPLVASREQVVSECYRLVTLIAQNDPQRPDPTEVIKLASEFKGRGMVNAASMSDDRLAHTIAYLRRWLRKLNGEADLAGPPAAKAAQGVGDRVMASAAEFVALTKRGGSDRG